MGAGSGGTPTLAVVGAFSIDSVVTADGRALTGKVGGNSVWSSLGALVSGIAPRILSLVGSDYPVEVLERLDAAGIDVSAVLHLDREHPVRITFAHLPGGRRAQPAPPELVDALAPHDRAAFVDTTRRLEVLELGSPRGDDVPEAWLEEVDAWHLPLLPLGRHLSVVERLGRARGIVLSDCPARSELVGDAMTKLAPMLPVFDVFLPSTSDLDVFAPHDPTSATVAAMHAAGAGVMVLKAGEHGVFVDDGRTTWHVPAHPGVPADPTGAGDTFCGGFMVGLATTGDPVQAAALGSAAASFAVATADPLTLVDVDPDLTRARARDLLAAARRVDGIPSMELQEGRTA